MTGKFISIKSKYTFNEMVCLLALFIYLVVAAFDLTMLGEMFLFQKISDAFKLLTIAMLGINAIGHIKLYNSRQIIFFLLYGIIAVLCTIKSRSMAPFLLLMIWSNMRGVDFDDILVVFLIANSIVFVLTLVMCAVKLIPDRVFSGNCHSMGFAYKNACGMSFMSILIAYLALRKNNARWYEYFIAIVCVMLVFAGCRSKSALIISVLAVLISALINIGFFQKNEAVVRMLAVSIYPVLMVISLISAKFPDYSAQPWQKINSILTGRLQLGRSAYETYQILPFGQYIEWIGNSDYKTEVQGAYNFVDSSYLSIPLMYGWIFAAILIIAFTALCIYTYKKKSWYHIMILITMAMHGFVESALITISFNPALVAIGILAFSNTNDREIKMLELNSVKDCIKKNKKTIITISIIFASIFIFLNYKAGCFYQSGIKESSIVDPLRSSIVYIVVGLLLGTLAGIVLTIFNLLYQRKRIKWTKSDAL